MNLFVFMSEAFKRTPDFLDIHAVHRKRELRAWSEIIDTAKRNKEVKSTIANEELCHYVSPYERRHCHELGYRQEERA